MSTPPRLTLLIAVLGAVTALLGGCASGPGPGVLESSVPVISAPAAPPGPNALPRWRSLFDPLISALDEAGEVSLFEHEAADTPLVSLAAADLGPAFSLLRDFELAPGEALALDPVVGPETPFPDHQPLRIIVALRTIKARLLLRSGDVPGALTLLRQNLAQARAELSSQCGIIPLIHATGVWQSALDGIHAAARSPAVSATDARVLLAEIQADRFLASLTLARAFSGEFTGVYRVVVDRMPDTDDPDLFLSSVSTLGMEPPAPLEPGELGLGLTDHVILDRAATLAAYQRDLAPYLAALARAPVLPRGLYDATTGPTLAAYRAELGAFWNYAAGESPATLEHVVLARAALESTANPGGKLLAAYLTPPWEVLIASTLRREAQRAALSGLLAWRVHGRPAPWSEIVAAGLLPAAPADPFADGSPLLFSAGPDPRVWSVYLDAKDDGGHLVGGNSGQPDDLVWIW